MGWINDDLGRNATLSFERALYAFFFRSVANEVANAGGRAPVAQVLAIINEVEACQGYIDVRLTLRNLLFGRWKKGADGLVLVRPVPFIPLQECCIQCFCAPLARAQEIDAAMRWRTRNGLPPARFGNPFCCECGFVVDGTYKYYEPVDKDLQLPRADLSPDPPPVMLRF
jgi:hypothetical protein